MASAIFAVRKREREAKNKADVLRNQVVALGGTPATDKLRLTLKTGAKIVVSALNAAEEKGYDRSTFRERIAAGDVEEPAKNLLNDHAANIVQNTPPPSSSFTRYKPQVRAFYMDVRIQILVAMLIVANFIVNIVQAQLWPSEKLEVPGGRGYAKVFKTFEWFFNISFTIELATNMYANWFNEFWKSGWNVFDFLTVFISWMFAVPLPFDLPKPLRLMRMVRALRVFRLFKRVKSLRKILESLARAVPGVMNAFLIMTIVMCIYAILAVDFFRTKGKNGRMEFEWCSSEISNGEIKSQRRWESRLNMTTGAWYEVQVEVEGCPLYYTGRNEEFGHEYFGTFFKSLYTMFQILTGDSWSEAIGRPLLANWGPFDTGLFFVSFYLLHAVVLINVVVAVLLEKMVEEDPNDEEQEETEIPPGRAAINELTDKIPAPVEREKSSTKMTQRRLELDVAIMKVKIDELRDSQKKIMALLKDLAAANAPRHEPRGLIEVDADEDPTTPAQAGRGLVRQYTGGLPRE